MTSTHLAVLIEHKDVCYYRQFSSEHGGWSDINNSTVRSNLDAIRGTLSGRQNYFIEDDFLDESVWGVRSRLNEDGQIEYPAGSNVQYVLHDDRLDFSAGVVDPSDWRVFEFDDTTQALIDAHGGIVQCTSIGMIVALTMLVLADGAVLRVRPDDRLGVIFELLESPRPGSVGVVIHDISDKSCCLSCICMMVIYWVLMVL